MDNYKIEVGDRVCVSFVTPGGNVQGTVLSRPQDVGDAWAIRKDDGGLIYIQMYETMLLVSKRPGAQTGAP